VLGAVALAVSARRATYVRIRPHAMGALHAHSRFGRGRRPDPGVKAYGVRDVERLANELQRDVERELARTGGLDEGARVELTLVDAKPNRPTFKQLSATPGLSFQSFGVGGATIEGRIVAANGAVTPVGYSWYESDIRQAAHHGTWTDAEWAIDRFASRLVRGQAVTQR
jgi:hypothetical protein